jgi:hypothetical protein
VSCVLAGGGPAGSFCTSSSQCAKGSTCWENACHPYCGSPGAACAGAGLGVCFAPEDAAGATTPNLDVCAVKCDVGAPSAACGSNNCLYFAGDHETDCRASGTLDVFDPCSSFVDCKQGLACVYNDLFGYECEPWCRLGQSDCGIFADCVDVYGADAPTSGGYTLGHCQ